MPQIYIPDDWDEETWDCIMVEWPSSVQWRALLAGLVSTPARGRFWDRRSGTITAAQDIGREIIERNPINMSCEEIAIELQNIVTALAGIDVKIDNSVDVQQSLVNETMVQTTAILNASLTASATSSAYANATAIAHVLVDARPLGGDAPAITPEEEKATGISDVETDDDERCAATYWMTLGIRDFIHWLRTNYIPFWFSTSNAALSAISIALTAGARAVPGIAPVLLGGAALTTLVEYVVFLEKSQLADPVLEELDDYLTDHFEDVRCELYNFSIGGTRTDDLSESMVSYFLLQGLSANTIPILMAWFNLNTLALVIFQSPLVPFPELPSGFNCDTDCGQV